MRNSLLILSMVFAANLYGAGVPENLAVSSTGVPGTWTMFVTGLGLLAVARKR